MNERKKLSFAGGLVIYVTVLLTLIIVGLAFWWHYLSCYETSRAERVLDNYMQQGLQADLETAIMDYCDKTSAGYQSAMDISGVLIAALGGDAWHYEANKEASTEQEPVFNLYSGDIAAGQVRLTLGEDSTLNMGFRSWGNPTPSFDFDQFGRSLTITVPYGCAVQLNGHPLGEDAVQDTIGIYPHLKGVESMLTKPNQLLVYTVDRVFADVAVEYPVGFTSLPSKTEGVYYAGPVCDDAMGEQLTEYAKNFIRAYVTYTANAESLWTLQQFLVTDSALYKKVTDNSIGLKWGEGVNAEIQTIEIKNFLYYGNAITCDASYITTRDDGDRFESMKILLVNTDIGWRVAHIVLPEPAPSPSPEASPAAEPTT